jgi:glutathione-regulated potassium-efflux system ancillary protein KefC
MVDPLIIMLAFAAGLAVRKLGYPPMLGYLIAGFTINQLPIEPGETIQYIADGGVTMLLFTIGLKLNIRQLMMPQIWAVASIHMLLSVAFIGGLLSLAMPLIASTAGVAPHQAWLIAFALSFSSTVFAVKIFEERGEMEALHAKISIGILIIQDIIAVMFLVLSTGKMPEFSSLMLFVTLILFASRHPLLQIMRSCGHGELLLLFGLCAAFGGSALFESFNIKGDLGALLIGVLLAGTAKSTELSEALLSLKDLFLVGFFVTIGLNGQPDSRELGIAIALGALVFFKPILYYLLMTAFRLRARTSLLASLSLFNYSEFGLIVAALAASSGLLDKEWLVIIALALSFSFVIAVPFNTSAHWLYRNYGTYLRRVEKPERLPLEKVADLGNARIIVLGMGRVGLGAYHYLVETQQDTVIGVEESPKRIAALRKENINIVAADANDEDFWLQTNLQQINLIMVNLSRHSENLAVCQLLLKLGFNNQIAAIARYPDQSQELKELGCISFNLYQEAGFGFAEHVHQQILKGTDKQ